MFKMKLCYVVRLKSDDRYNTALPRLVSLLNIASESPSHVQAQESIAVCSHYLFFTHNTVLLACTSWLQNSDIKQL